MSVPLYPLFPILQTSFTALMLPVPKRNYKAISALWHTDLPAAQIHHLHPHLYSAPWETLKEEISSGCQTLFVEDGADLLQS